MIVDDHFFHLLGERLRDLAPLIKAAVQALDQPGSRALRRKLDGKLHCAVHTYNTAWRLSFPASDYPLGDVVDYDRVTPVRWGGRKRQEATDADSSGSAQAARHERAGLRLVVDNAGDAS